MNYVLPPSWQWVRLGEIATVIRGVTFGRNDTTDSASDDTYPILRAGNISDELLTDRELVWVPSGRVSPEQLMQVGDVAICMSSGSADVVGKTAQLPTPWIGSVGAFCALIRATSPVVDREYFGFVFTSPVFTFWRRRQSMGANIQNLRLSDVKSVMIPVPPLLEQRRIVEIVNEARDIRRLRQQADDVTAQLIPAIFNEMFGGSNGFAHLPDVAIRKVVESAEYGTSKAANEDAVGIPVLRMNNVTYEGELDLSDIKHVDLSESEVKKQMLRENDVLFNRTNSLALVGKTGLWDGQFKAVAASYFVRVRLNLERVDPRYFVAFLNLTSTKRRLQNMAKQAIGMSNINATELQRIRIPLPELGLQRQFGDQIAAMRQYKSSVADSVQGEQRLTQSLLAYAFSGQLTADWREGTREQLAQEAAERDQWLRVNGVKLTAKDHHGQGPADLTDGLAWELNSDQKALLAHIQQFTQNDNGGVFTLSSLTLTEPLDKLPVDSVRRHLDVLAARGLIKAISRRAGAGGSVNIGFGNAYRLSLRAEYIAGAGDAPDFARLSQLNDLSKQGRVISVSASNQLELSASAEVANENIKGDN